MARPTVQSATSLRRAPQDDRHARMIKYSIMMGIRMVCIVLVFVFPGLWWLWGIGAVFLPYVAVIVANAGSSAGTDAVHPLPVSPAAIEASRRHDDMPG